MSLRRPIAALAAALVAAGAVVLLSAAPALAVSTVTGSGTGTILTQGTALSHNAGQPEDVAVAGADVYVANYDNAVVDVYSESTGAYIKSVAVGTNPIALAVSSDKSEVFVVDQSTPDVEIIRTSDNTVTSSFSVATDPIAIALSPSATTVYVFFNGAQQTTSYDLSGTALHTSTVSGIGTGFHIAVSLDGTKVYVTYRDSVPSGGDGGIAILDSALNTITIVSVPSASGLAISPDGTKVFVGGTTPTFIGHVAELNAATNVPTGNDAVVESGPESMVASPNGGWIYADSANQGHVDVIDRSTFTSVAEGATGASADAISADGLHLYVADRGNHHTDVFSIAQVTVSANAAILPGTASTGFTVSVADGNSPVNDYSADTVVVNLYNSANALVASSSSVPMTVAGTLTVPIDTSTLPIGVYYATATLTDPVATTETSATVTGFAVRATLATTGQDPSMPVTIGLILLVAGALLFAGRAATLRRRSTT
jgi:DNA-binding beta-propeller fold protein YncE